MLSAFVRDAKESPIATTDVHQIGLWCQSDLIDDTRIDALRDFACVLAPQRQILYIMKVWCNFTTVFDVSSERAIMKQILR